jgi:hypothetical protein
MLARFTRQAQHSQPPRDAAPGRVVRAHLDAHSIALRQTNVMNVQAPAPLCEDASPMTLENVFDSVEPPTAALRDDALEN